MLADTGSSLITDLYQITMAQSYWKSGRADMECVFHMFFRKHPFNGGYTVCSGLGPFVDWLRKFHTSESDIAYLGSLTGNDGQPLFEPEFLAYLSRLNSGLHLEIDAVPEGTIVFPNEPLVRVRGPILEAQLLETAMLCLINFHTLVATKAARVVRSASAVLGSSEEEEPRELAPVLEFGLRRAQGIDGGVAATRAAFVGGCCATSNVIAGKLYGIPVKGTHAHSWVQSFGEGELAAFRAYAEACPNNCVFLVDTYDTEEGIAHAIEVGKELRERGFELGGIRLDSGDLAWLSKQARAMLDKAGFPNAKVFASNNLNENVIRSLKLQGAPIAVWGVGTKLVTCYDQPALGGVYKLAATKDSQDAQWRHAIKLSEMAVKVSTPGILNARRFRVGDEFVGDVIYDVLLEKPAEGAWTAVDPRDATRTKTFPADAAFEDLLVPVMRAGKIVWKEPPLKDVRQRVQDQLTLFHPGIKRLENPHKYPCGLEAGLYDYKIKLIRQEKEKVRLEKEGKK